MTTDHDASRVAYEHPWKGAADGVAANFALADLVNNLPRQVTLNGRVHPESLLAASGAIAGFAAQRAVMAGLSAEDIVDPASGYMIVRTTSGGLFFFGNPLDRALVPQSPSDLHKLWALAGSGAIAAGLDPDGLPPLEPMFEHVAMSLGGDREGMPSLADCQFQAPAFALLRSAWPLAQMCFNSQISGQALDPPVIISQRWRPVIAALAASKMIQDAAGTVPPLRALRIVMETAIYASRLAPAAVEAPAPVPVPLNA